MIITLHGLARSLAKTGQSHLALDSRPPPPSRLTYSKAGMRSVLACCSCVVATGLIVCITNRDHLGLLWSGLVMQLIGVYLLGASVREWHNLDLITKHFDQLSDSAKEEIIGQLAHTPPYQGVLGLIEQLLNSILGST